MSAGPAYAYYIAGERQDLGAFAAEAVRRAAARLGQAPAVGLCHAADLAALQAATPTVRLASSRYVQRRGLMLAAGAAE